MSEFQEAKLWLAQNTGLARDALHIYVALAVFLGSIVLLRWRADGWRPWLLVLTAALLGEAWDARDMLTAGRTLRPWSHWHDVWNMMVWPTVIALMVRAGKLVPSGVDRREQPLE